MLASAIGEAAIPTFGIGLGQAHEQDAAHIQYLTQFDPIALSQARALELDFTDNLLHIVSRDDGVTFVDQPHDEGILNGPVEGVVVDQDGKRAVALGRVAWGNAFLGTANARTSLKTKSQYPKASKESNQFHGVFLDQPLPAPPQCHRPNADAKP